jgi:carbon-monoxide dehydrogenase medium subunit
VTFEYHRPRSLDEAAALLGQDGAVALAGGTDLLVGLRHRTTTPRAIVDIKRIDELSSSIEAVEGRLAVGSRVVMGDIATDPRIRAHLPALAASAGVVGSVQIRNRATLAGNVCNASPAADTVPALLVYGASVTVRGTNGERRTPLDEFFTGPGRTVLTSGEVVTGIEIPLPEKTGSAFARVTRRKGVDLASVNLACAVRASGEVRFGLGAVGPTPILAESTIDDLSSEDGWDSVLSQASPISDVRAGADYRLAMLRIHARRAFEAARVALGETS